MTIGINTSPMAGLAGDKVTASMVESRLRSEVVGNVSLRVLPTERPDAWEVQGRGELQLAILVEQMRREGFELTVGKPQVVTRRIDGVLHEPVERVAIDAPEEYLGVVTQLFALRKGRTEALVNHGSGWVRMDVLVPARGLVGFRTEFLTETRGTGILHHVFERFEPWFGELRKRPTGALVADRRGTTTAFALLNLQERGSLFVGPGVDVYEGMIVGENARAEDLDVNATKEKKLTNMRSSTAEELVRLIPPRPLSLDQAWSTSARTSASRSRRSTCGFARWSSPRSGARPPPVARRAASHRPDPHPSPTDRRLGGGRVREPHAAHGAEWRRDALDLELAPGLERLRPSNASCDPTYAPRRSLSVEVASTWPALPQRPVTQLGREAGDDCFGGLPPEAKDLDAQDLSGLLVAAPVARYSLEAHRRAPDNAAGPPVLARPAEGLDGGRDHGQAFFHCDHGRAGVHRSRIAKTLTRALGEDTDHMSRAHEFARSAQPVPIGFAATDRKAARPCERLSHDGDLEDLVLRHVEDRPVGERADEWRIDRGEMIDGQDGAPGPR